jgi:hypothetical protein
MKHLVFSAAVAAALVVAACSKGAGDEDAGPTCTPYLVPASTNLQQPTVSFKNDVLPIAVLSCAFSSCHGLTGGGNNGIYWGSKTDPNDPSAIRAGVVGVKSLEDPSMAFVTPGDPANSYVMHKLDGDNCTLADACKAGNRGDCGDTMPQQSDLLPVDKRDVIRRWIAQGAPDN